MDIAEQIKALVNSGTNFANEGKYNEAELDYLKALQLDPTDTTILSNLASLYGARKRYDAALVYHRRVAELDPYDVENWVSAVCHATNHCFWTGEDELIEGLRKAMNELPAFFSTGFFMNLKHTFEDLYHWQTKRAAGDAKVQEILSQKTFDHSKHKVGKKIKIGWFTTDIGPSPCGYVLGSFFENMNHEDFEWHCFCYNKEFVDFEKVSYKKSLIDREVKCFDFFYNISDIDDESQIAQKIYDQGIDIIIDVNMMGNDRWRALAYRPAPIIVGFLGVPTTTGLPYYDYMIGDKETIPEDKRSFFSEKIMDISPCYHPADIKAEISESPVSRSDLMLPENKVIYCSLVTPYKITPTYFDMWSRILKAVPDSVLWLRTREYIDEDNLRREAMNRGISPDRIIFLSWLDSKALFLKCFKFADLFLDTEIWQAHSTCLESLTCGIPLLTCPGNSFCSRVPATMLKTFGLPEMVCKDIKEYEQKAIDFGLHPEKLQAAKEKVRSLKTPDNPLFDMVSYARKFENILKQILKEKNLK